MLVDVRLHWDGIHVRWRVRVLDRLRPRGFLNVIFWNQHEEILFVIVFGTVQRHNLVTYHLVSCSGVSLQLGDERSFEWTDRAEISLERVGLEVLQERLQVVELRWTVRTGVRHERIVERTFEKMILVL